MCPYVVNNKLNNMKQLFYTILFVSFTITSCLTESKKQPVLSNALILVSTNFVEPTGITLLQDITEEEVKRFSIQFKK
jgi:hypothetical protein